MTKIEIGTGPYIILATKDENINWSHIQKIHHLKLEAIQNLTHLKPMKKTAQES